MSDTAQIKIDADLAAGIAKEIADSFHLFKSRMTYEKIKIDPYIVLVAAVSFLKDLERYSHFHDSPYPNEFKRAGYLAYWLVKTKPISSTETEPPDYQLNSKYLSVNEEFAVFHALSMLKIKSGHIPDKQFLSRLVYALYYRDIPSKSLVLIMEMLFAATPAHLRSK